MSDTDEFSVNTLSGQFSELTALAQQARSKVEIAHMLHADGTHATAQDHLNAALVTLDVLERRIEKAATAYAEQLAEMPVTRPDTGERAQTLLSAAWLQLQDAQKSADNVTAVERLADALASVTEVVESLQAGQAAGQTQQPARPLELERLWPELHGDWPEEYAARLRASTRAPVIHDGVDDYTVVLDSTAHGWGMRRTYTLATLDRTASVLLRAIPDSDTDAEGRPRPTVSIHLDWQTMFRLVAVWLDRRALAVDREAEDGWDRRLENRLSKHLTDSFYGRYDATGSGDGGDGGDEPSRRTLWRWQETTGDHRRPQETISMSTSTPELRSQHARLAALARLAQSTPQQVAAPAQRGLRVKFVREVVNEAAARGETLGADEQARRAQAKLDAHMARMTFARMRAAAERRELRALAEQRSTSAQVMALCAPQSACPGCVREAGEKWPGDTTSQTCERHGEELRQQILPMRRPCNPDLADDPTRPHPSQPVQQPARGRKGGRRAD